MARTWGTAVADGVADGPVLADGPDSGPGLAVASQAGTTTSQATTGPAAAGAEVPFRLGDRPPLTGIRALGIAAVLVYHSNYKTLPGAWSQLQMFFVLSGFLITSMLAGEGRRNGRISLKGFYSRRAVRLLPPLLLTITLMAIYASFVFVADASHRIWGDSAAALFYYADYRQALGYQPFFGFLAQTWSLSVEEQFYIIWSVLMVVAVAMGRRRLAYAFAVVGIALSAGDRLYLTLHTHPFTDATFARNYYAFDSRADALMLGCLLGLLASDGRLSGWPRWAMRTLTAAAVAAAGVAVWILFYAPLWHESLLVWQLPAASVIYGIIIVYFVVCPMGVGSRVIGIGVLVFVGELSYSLYVLHFPVYLAIQPSGTHWSYWPTELLRLAIIFAIAIASWFLIERPLTRWRKRSAAR